MFDENEGMDAATAAFGKLGPIDETPLDERRDDEEENDESGIDIPQDADDDVTEDGDEPSQTDEQSDEPEAPAIDPPARWDADQKKVFATLPPEAQRIIAAQATEQERAIGRKAEEAAAARKAHEAVTQEAIDIHQRFADKLTQYAQAFEPQRPDYALLATDPQAFAQQLAYYEQATAQGAQIAQQAAQARQQAEAIQQHQLQQEARLVHETLTQAWGEKWANPVERQKVLDELKPVADELGYAPDVQAQANASDLLALRKAADWKTKAEKWDQLQSSKMGIVRDAKLKPKVQTPGAAQPKGSAQRQGLQDSMTRLRKTGDVRDAAAAFSRLR